MKPICVFCQQFFRMRFSRHRNFFGGHPYPLTGVTLDSQGYPMGHQTGVYEAAKELAAWLNELPLSDRHRFLRADVEDAAWRIVNCYLEEVRRRVRDVSRV